MFQGHPAGYLILAALSIALSPVGAHREMKAAASYLFVSATYNAKPYVTYFLLLTYEQCCNRFFIAVIGSKYYYPTAIQ